LAGMKYIYSEALLPEHDEEETFLEAIRTVEKTLLPEWVERNRISDKVKKFVKKN